MSDVKHSVWKYKETGFIIKLQSDLTGRKNASFISIFYTDHQPRSKASEGDIFNTPFTKSVGNIKQQVGDTMLILEVNITWARYS